MRWEKKVKKDRCIGDERTVKKVLFWPTTINGETRWLEMCEIKQRCVRQCNQLFQYLDWINIEWVDNKENK